MKEKQSAAHKIVFGKLDVKEPLMQLGEYY
jgi:hypothetical protein